MNMNHWQTLFKRTELWRKKKQDKENISSRMSDMSWPWNVHCMEVGGGCVHILRGRVLLLQGIRPMFYQAWTLTKTGALMSVHGWRYIRGHRWSIHTHPMTWDPDTNTEQATQSQYYKSAHNVLFMVAAMTSIASYLHSTGSLWYSYKDSCC